MDFRSTIKIFALCTIISVTSASCVPEHIIDINIMTSDEITKEVRDMLRKDPNEKKIILDTIDQLVATKFVQEDIAAFIRDLKATTKVQEKLPVEAKNKLNHEYGQLILIISEAAKKEFNRSQATSFLSLLLPSLYSTIVSSMAKYNEKFRVKTKLAMDEAIFTLNNFCTIPKLIKELEIANTDLKKIVVYYIYTRKMYPHGGGFAVVDRQIETAKTVKYLKVLLEDALKNLEEQGASLYALLNIEKLQTGISMVASIAELLRSLAGQPGNGTCGNEILNKKHCKPFWRF